MDSEKRVCAACRQPISDREALVACSDCGRSYHLGCWDQGGRCVTDNCFGRPIYHPVAEAAEKRCYYCSSKLNPGETSCQSCGRKVQESDPGIFKPDREQVYRSDMGSGYHDYRGSQGYQDFRRYQVYQNIPNHLVWAILATIFCCPPFGIVSIVYAAQVNSLVAAGNYEGAQRSSEIARKWCLAATIVGAILNLAYIAIMAFSVVLPQIMQ